MKKKRDPFKALMHAVKKNGVSRDKNGEFTVFISSTVKKRVEGGGGVYGKSQKSQFRPATKVYITEDDLKQVYARQDGKCYWLGIPMNMDLIFPHIHGPYHPLAPSVDRIDDTGDYTIDNIVICVRLANLGRCKCSFERFGEIMQDTLRMIRNEPNVKSLERHFQDG